MVWPTKTLTSAGFKDFKSPIENIKGKAPVDAWTKDDFKGKHGNWRSHDISYKPKADWTKPDDMKESKWKDRNEEEDKKARESGISYWTIKSNPLFEHAAGKLGIDWKSFINQYADAQSYEGLKTQAAASHQGSVGRKQVRFTMKGGGFAWADYNEKLPTHQMAAQLGGDNIRVIGGTAEAPYRTRYGLDGRVSGSDLAMENIYRMNEWINNTVKKWNEKYDAPIIERGPTHDQYGLPKGTDPWEFYGLDKRPRTIPKSLDVDYNYTLTEAEDIQAKYHTPHGFQKIDFGDRSARSEPYGKDFKQYLKDMEFAQEHGFIDENLGNYGDSAYRAGLDFIFGKGASGENGTVRIFGQKDYDALVDQGLSDDEIKDVIKDRHKDGPMIMGPTMAAKLGAIYDPKHWGQPGNTFGEKGLKLLQMQGLSDKEVLQYAIDNNLYIGAAVKNKFGIRTKSDGTIDYYYTDPHGDNKFGMDDYYELQGQGLSNQRIRQIAKDLRKGGSTIGSKAAIEMQLSPTEYGAIYDTGHFSKTVLIDLLDLGTGSAEIYDLGNKNDVTLISGHVAKHVYGYEDRGDKGDFGMKDIGTVKDPNATDSLWTKSGKRPSKLLLSKIAGGTSNKIGKGAVDYIWGEELYSKYMTVPPDAADPNAKVFGLDTIEYLKKGHMDRGGPIKVIHNETIRAIARGAPYIGAEAARQLGLPARMPDKKPATTPKPATNVTKAISKTWDSATMDKGEKNAFGQADLDNLRTNYYSKDDIKRVVGHASEHNNNFKIGPAAAKDLWGYEDGSHGDGKGYFGKKDYDFLSSAGASNAVMRAVVRGLGLKRGTVKDYIALIQ